MLVVDLCMFMLTGFVNDFKDYWNYTWKDSEVRTVLNLCADCQKVIKWSEGAKQWVAADSDWIGCYEPETFTTRRHHTPLATDGLVLRGSL